MHNVYRDGRVHVCAVECRTCVFRPGNLMHLEPGRLAGMVRDARRADSTIVCHETLDSDNAGCRGFYDRHATQPLQIAGRLGLVVMVAPEGYDPERDDFDHPTDTPPDYEGDR